MTPAEYKREWAKRNPDKVREYKRRHRAKNRASYNAAKNAAAKRRRAANPAQALLKGARDAAAKHGYVAPIIAVLELSRLLESRGEICPICGVNPARHLDHDHVTGEVRGWLCNNCNSGLGFFGDDADRLYRAGDYIRGN